MPEFFKRDATASSSKSCSPKSTSAKITSRRNSNLQNSLEYSLLLAVLPPVLLLPVVILLVVMLLLLMMSPLVPGVGVAECDEAAPGLNNGNGHSRRPQSSNGARPRLTLCTK
jgi:hypothetical protein